MAARSRRGRHADLRGVRRARATALLAVAAAKRATRAAVFLTISLLLGPGMLINVILKDNWGRPRPGSVIELGGTQPYVHWWDRSGTCQNNCSFAAGGHFLTDVLFGALISLAALLAVYKLVFGGPWLRTTSAASAPPLRARPEMPRWHQELSCPADAHQPPA